MNESIEAKIELIEADITSAYAQAEAKGATLPQVQGSANLADTIRTIPFYSNREKHVNFRDIEGNVIYSFTYEQAQALHDLPAVPTDEEYIYSWNFTLEQIKSRREPLNIGLIRQAVDGFSRFQFELSYGDRLALNIPFTLITGSSVLVDWGDSTSPQNVTTSPAVHQYAVPGIYTVKIASNAKVNLTPTSSVYTSFALVSAHLECENLDREAFSNCYGLQKLSFSPLVQRINKYTFSNCRNLRYVAIPSTLSGDDNAFYNCTSLICVSLGHDSRFAGNSMFNGCSNLKSIVVRNVISRYYLSGCRRLQYAFVPATVRSIGDSAFSGCLINVADFSEHTSVPDIANAQVFSSLPADAVIYVKNQAMLEAFQNSTNWSDYASQIQIGGLYADT